MGARGSPKPAAANTRAKVHHQGISNKCNTTIKSASLSTTLQGTMLTRRRSLNLNGSAAPQQNASGVRRDCVKTSSNDLVEVAAQAEGKRQALAQAKLNQNKPSAQLGSVTKSGKKPSWARRPKPAHSGVPVPEKMKKLFEKLAKEAPQQIASEVRMDWSTTSLNAPQQNASEVQMDCVKASLNDKVKADAQPEVQRQPLTPLKQNNPPAPAGSVTKSGKKPSWARRPKPAHSGVPVPEKMRKLFEKLAKEGKQL